MMQIINSEHATGLFGKLPAHGDFIYRDLSTTFINQWDSWLQGFVNSSQEQLGEQWLDIYLTSPIWRFALSEGVIDENVWCGIVLPSVDRVGRYFPFSIVAKLPASVGAAVFCQTQSLWYEKMEALALSALDGQIAIDDLTVELHKHQPIVEPAILGRPCGVSNQNAVLSFDHQEQLGKESASLLLDCALTQGLKSYSVWQTQGSQFVAPTMFYSQQLPHLSGIAAMFDGRWEHWQWQPFIFNQQARK